MSWHHHSLDMHIQNKFITLHGRPIKRKHPKHLCFSYSSVFNTSLPTTTSSYDPTQPSQLGCYIKPSTDLVLLWRLYHLWSPRHDPMSLVQPSSLPECHMQPSIGRNTPFLIMISASHRPIQSKSTLDIQHLSSCSSVLIKTHSIPYPWYNPTQPLYLLGCHIESSTGRNTPFIVANLCLLILGCNSIFFIAEDGSSSNTSIFLSHQNHPIWPQNWLN